MDILLKNIQSIKNGQYTFPDAGLVQILGANSNGKSILIKVISAIATLKIKDNDERRALINDACEEGSVSMQYKGKMLIVKLHEDRNKCLVALFRSKDEKIIRTFRDCGIEELLEEFGFRVYNKNSLCLQVFETFGQMPFVNTSNAVNYEIVEAVTTDTVAQNFLTNFKEITHKKAREQLKQLDIKIEGLKQTRNSLVIFDHVAYSEMTNKMLKVYNVLKYLEPIHVEKLNIPPKVKFIDIAPPSIERVKFVTPMPVLSKVTSFTEVLKEMKSIREGKCPTCGKPLLEDSCSKEVM